MIEAWSKGEYDAIYFAIESDSFDPARNPEFWLSCGAFHVWNPGQAKPATTWEGQIDELMKQQATSMDIAERRRLFAEAQRVLAEHMPVLYFAAPKVILATSARVRRRDAVRAGAVHPLERRHAVRDGLRREVGRRWRARLLPVSSSAGARRPSRSW